MILVESQVNQLKQEHEEDNRYCKLMSNQIFIDRCLSIAGDVMDLVFVRCRLAARPLEVSIFLLTVYNPLPPLAEREII